ncbi:MAG TPA: hypothetical protein PKV44_01575 [Bacillota bacterium]|nr:hypothetical protein [Bacillota bacterium]HPE38888.1 hypothetical protein [Bacillota bacterium]
MAGDDYFDFDLENEKTAKVPMGATQTDTILRSQYAIEDEKNHDGKTVIAIGGDTIGDMDDYEHGQELLLTALHSLENGKKLPDEILLFHKAVLLVDEEHEAASIWQKLIERDVVIKACNESLFYYVKVPGNVLIECVSMADLVQTMLSAEKVIRF